MPSTVHPALRKAGQAPPQTTAPGGKEPFLWRGWSFHAPKGPILATHDADNWTTKLGMTLPEMVFGETWLQVKNEAQGVDFSFKAYEALDACTREVDVQVSVAETWKANKEKIPEAQKFDWTYSTKYRGTATKGGASWDPEPTEQRINFESLKQRAGEDILWSAEGILFEDELHDHGTSKLVVRIRVTQNYFYVLQRAFIRVDDVTVRLRETRLHHVFGSDQSLRQYTEKEEAYSTVKQSCSQRQLAEGVLDDADALAPKLQLNFEVTELFKHSEQASKQPGDVAAAVMKKEIAEKNAVAEAAFKKKFGNAKPSAGALLHRQRQHETRYFDSGDAFSGAGKKEDPLETGAEKRETLAVVQGQLEGADEAAKAAAAEADEIARKNAEAEAAFKKKFGKMKPAAGALLHRQRKHETRYFDSGDAFSGAGKKDAGGAGEEKRETLAVVQGQGEAAEGDAATEADEIALKNAAAEAAFKKKFGNAKPSAGALLHRQRKHETRYFDSGEAFSGVSKKEDPMASEDDVQGPLVVVQGQEQGQMKSPDSKAAADAEAAEIARKNAESEAKFKKKFGNVKPSAGSLLHRQRQHETRYFDSGDAFSGAGKKEDPLETGAEKRETLAVVQGQGDAGEAAKEADEIARKNAAAEAAFKKKFGNAKPSAGALLHRQRKHETRYFDSGEAFSGVSKKEDPLASEDDTQGPLAVVQGQ